MKSPAHPEIKIARVAINVRLYFDVPVASLDEATIRDAAHAELSRVEELERIRIKRLRFPAIYPCDDWPALETTDFDICEICPACEANKDTRFEL